MIAVSADKAAGEIVSHTLSKEVKANSGKIFAGKEEKPPIAYWRDPDVRDRLWSVTEALIESELINEIK